MLSACKYASRLVSIALFLISGLKATLWMRMSMCAVIAWPSWSIMPWMVKSPCLFERRSLRVFSSTSSIVS